MSLPTSSQGIARTISAFFTLLLAGAADWREHRDLGQSTDFFLTTSPSLIVSQYEKGSRLNLEIEIGIKN